MFSMRRPYARSANRPTLTTTAALSDIRRTSATPNYSFSSNVKRGMQTEACGLLKHVAESHRPFLVKAPLRMSVSRA